MPRFQLSPPFSSRDFATAEELEEFKALSAEILELEKAKVRLTSLRRQRHLLRDRWKKRKRKDAQD